MGIPFVPAHSSNFRAGRAASIQWIVVHYTANDGDTDAGNAHYFQGANRGASAHYFVDEDSVTQSVRDSDTAWHCGSETGYYYNACRNANSIGIEMCSDKQGGKYILTEATVARAVALVRSLMAQYNIPVSRVCRHYDVTHKACPEPWVRNPQLWEDFKRRLTAKEDDEVTQAEFEAMYNKVNPLYKTINDVPSYWQQEVREMLDCGAINGGTEAAKNPDDVNMRHEALQAAIVAYRAAVKVDK